MKKVQSPSQNGLSSVRRVGIRDQLKFRLKPSIRRFPRHRGPQGSVLAATLQGTRL